MLIFESFRYEQAAKLKKDPVLRLYIKTTLQSNGKLDLGIRLFFNDKVFWH